MSHARYIGRVGALAVTLGVGWAVATAAPGVAYADDSGTADTPSASAPADTGSSAASARSERRARAEQRRQDARAAAADRRAQRRAVREARAADTDSDTDEPAHGVTTVSVATTTASSQAESPSDSDPAAPLAATTMLTAAAASREERQALRRAAVAPQPQANALAVDDTPNVLVIGVDGTNLSKILANPANTNLFGLMQGGTTAASTIVGHTTISNPSWTSILTGAWGEKTGVINNVFTPWTYDAWPTVFNQLEGFDSTIETTAISDWDVIAGIAGAGSIPVDNNVYFTQVAGDTDWSKTDDLVGGATTAAIAGADLTVANFVFSYFVGVDENGHMHGGDSPEYAAAITNVDENIGEILAAVAASGEQWTILVVTDHGHQPQKGIGHGFQSPPETSTFVIANGGAFDSGAINLTYSIVDITPTVVTLFGGQPSPDSDGESLTDQADNNVFPINDDGALRAGLLNIIAKYGYPDIGTQLTLSLRTIVTSVPYFVFGATTQLTAGLQDLADQGIPLISLVAKIAIIPVQFVGDLAYVATNLAAQIVAKLTGVEGASIFPLWPPAPPSVQPQPEEGTTPLDLFAVCGDDPASAGVLRCRAPSIAV